MLSFDIHVRLSMCACLLVAAEFRAVNVGKLLYSGEVHLAAAAADATDTPNLHRSNQRPRRSPGRLSPGARSAAPALLPAGAVGMRRATAGPVGWLHRRRPMGEPWPR